MFDTKDVTIKEQMKRNFGSISVKKYLLRLLPKKIDPKHFPFCSVIRVHEKKKKKKR